MSETRSLATAPQYPAGARLRVKEICRNGRIGHGLLPISERTWLRWVAEGRVSQGEKIGRTRAWRIEEVISVAEGTAQ